MTDGPFPRRPGGRRRASVRVRGARKRPASSTRWLDRQLNDPYVAEAQRQGFRSRAAFKLIQLDDRFRVLGPGKRVLDLGAAPGGWLQVAASRVRPGAGGGTVVGVDLLPIAPVAGCEVIHGDVCDDVIRDRLAAALGGRADVVLSDMAAPTTGHPGTDHLRTMGLAETAFEVARDLLTPGGAFICKLFQGGAEKPLLDQLKRDFRRVRHAKPPASRPESTEAYLVALGYRGRNGAPRRHDTRDHTSAPA